MPTATTAPKPPTASQLTKEISRSINQIRGVFNPFSMRDVKDRPDVLEAEQLVATSSALVLNGGAGVEVFRDALGALETAYMGGLKVLRQDMQNKIEAQTKKVA